MTLFPCGANGSANFCPNVCQYGKFCKIKDRKKDTGPSAKDLIHEKKEELDEDDFRIETY